MKLIEGYHYKNRDYLKIYISNGIIERIVLSNDTPEKERMDQLLVPGLFDIQVNGYAGIDFNEPDTTPEEILEATKMLNKNGTVKFLPTIITNSPEKISRLIQNILYAVESFPQCRESIVGIHLEGPFLSNQEGPRGAHSATWIQKPSLNYVKKWYRESKGLFKILTISPEYEEAFEVISYCRSKKIICSLGHTAANSDQIRTAIYYGASMSTHLGNGCHLQLPRHRNYIYDQAESDELTASLIADGQHLPKIFLKNLLKLKKDRTVLVSDSSAIAGLSPGIYHTHIGGKVILDENNRLCLFDNPEILAGSAVNLMEEIRYVSENQILSFADAVYMASVKPANLLNDCVDITVGNNGSFLICKLQNSGIQIIDVLINGVSISD